MDERFIIELSMTDNGLDFIKRSLIEMQDENETSIKYAVLHLSAGLELILKSRLQKEHWSFLFEDINKASYQNYVSGNFKSISFDNLLSRLMNVCQIEISQGTKKRFQDLKASRNKIEHYHMDIHKAALESTAYKVLSFLIPFIHKEELVSRDNDLLIYINEQLLQMDNYLSQRKREVSAAIKGLPDSVNFLDCPHCMQKDTLRLDKAYCYFCNTQFRNLAVELIPKFIDDEHVFQYREFDSIEFCPYCRSETMIVSANKCVCLDCLKVINPDEYIKCVDCSISHVVGEEEGEYYGEEYICWTCFFIHD